MINKKKGKFLSLFAGIFLALFMLTGCSQPSSQSLLKKAQKTDIENFQLQLDEKSSSEHFYGQVSYQRSPFLMKTKLTEKGDQTINMWVQGNYAYVKYFKGKQAAWYKAKLSQYTTIKQFQATIKQMDQLYLSKQSAKLFKVASTTSGYKLTYTGKNKNLWQDITEKDGLATLTSDASMVKATIKRIQMTILLNQRGRLTGVKLTAKYQPQGKQKATTTKLSLLKINQGKKLTLPEKVKKNSVDITKLNK